MSRASFEFRRLTASLLFSSLAGGPLVAAEALPCATVAFDDTVENGFAIGSGQSLLELCSKVPNLAISEGNHCTWGGNSHFVSMRTQWTALGNLPSTSFRYRWRDDAAGEPGDSLDPTPNISSLPSPPLFPDAVTVDGNPFLESGDQWQRRLDYLWRQADQEWVCSIVDQAATGRFITVDQSPATEAIPCRTRADGSGPWEDCATQNPAFRALGLSHRTAPIAGFASSAQVFPPIEGADTGFATGFYTGSQLPAEPPPGDNTFRFEIQHTVVNPLSAHLHVGYPGTNGPTIVTFPDATSPIELSGVVLTAQQIRDLGNNKLYFDLHTAEHPQGAIRGQLIPAQPGIFAAGFELGDTSEWSDTVP